MGLLDTLETFMNYRVSRVKNIVVQTSVVTSIRLILNVKFEFFSKPGAFHDPEKTSDSLEIFYVIISSYGDTFAFKGLE